MSDKNLPAHVMPRLDLATQLDDLPEGSVIVTPAGVYQAFAPGTAEPGETIAVAQRWAKPDSPDRYSAQQILNNDGHAYRLTYGFDPRNWM